MSGDLNHAERKATRGKNKNTHIQVVSISLISFSETLTE